jgi:hypothetical protein
LIRQLPGFESRHLSKIQNGKHKQRSGLNTLAPPFPPPPQKKNTKNYYENRKKKAKAER